MKAVGIERRINNLREFNENVKEATRKYIERINQYKEDNEKLNRINRELHEKIKRINEDANERFYYMRDGLKEKVLEERDSLMCQGSKFSKDRKYQEFEKYEENYAADVFSDEFSRSTTSSVETHMCDREVKMIIKVSPGFKNQRHQRKTNAICLKALNYHIFSIGF